MICNGREIIDEASIEYNNRDTKKFTPELIYHYKYHRHYELAVDIFLSRMMIATLLYDVWQKISIW